MHEHEMKAADSHGRCRRISEGERDARDMVNFIFQFVNAANRGACLSDTTLITLPCPANRKAGKNVDARPFMAGNNRTPACRFLETGKKRNEEDRGCLMQVGRMRSMRNNSHDPDRSLCGRAQPQPCGR